MRLTVCLDFIICCLSFFFVVFFLGRGGSREHVVMPLRLQNIKPRIICTARIACWTKGILMNQLNVKSAIKFHLKTYQMTTTSLPFISFYFFFSFASPSSSSSSSFIVLRIHSFILRSFSSPILWIKLVCTRSSSSKKKRTESPISSHSNFKIMKMKIKLFDWIFRSWMHGKCTIWRRRKRVEKKNRRKFNDLPMAMQNAPFLVNPLLISLMAFPSWDELNAIIILSAKKFSILNASCTTRFLLKKFFFRSPSYFSEIPIQLEFNSKLKRSNNKR